MDYAVEVIVWTCVALFVAASVITLCALTGYLKLGTTREEHKYYLRYLFRILIVVVVGASTSVFAGYVRAQIQPVLEGVQTTQTFALDGLEQRLRSVEKIVNSGKQLSGMNDPPDRGRDTAAN